MTETTYDYGYNRFNWGERAIETGLLSTLDPEDVDFVNFGGIEDVPEDRRNSIEDLLRENNQPYDPQSVVNKYKEWLIQRTR
ncbi:unnamed protein product [marine sediment metagenome]|uniref:Uncharacterized protein n=1 Tax=marine sediment metagenome TaxID=412755 RepID=X0W787_9ZZZZ